MPFKGGSQKFPSAQQVGIFPMWHTVYEELKGWQGSIGSLIGFGALMTAAMWNFKLNRQRDALLREEESLSVAAALYGEIILLRKELDGLARAVAHITNAREANFDSIIKFDAHFVEAHMLPEPLLYKALASKIGLLSPDLVIAITEFYENFHEAKTWLPRLIEYPDREYNYGVSSVLIPACDAIKNVRPALLKIEQMAHVPNPAGDLGLGDTEDVITEEELRSTPYD